jgi:hypothetical protein
MAGENQTFDDMDTLGPDDLKYRMFSRGRKSDQRGAP